MEHISDAVPPHLKHEGRFLTLCRVGFLGRGMLYLLIAYLAFNTGRTEDLTGALEYIGHGTGRILLILIAAGLFAYGMWRLADAAFGVENPGNAMKAWRKRAAAAFIGSIYLYLGYKAVRVLLAGEAGTMTPQQHADTVLDLPGGSVILGLAGLIMAVAGLNQFRKAMKCAFLSRLDQRAQAEWVKWLGRLGYFARGAIFLVVGWLILRAAIDGRAKEAGGMEQALDFFSGPVLLAVCAGLALFGAFSIIEALYRHIHAPDAEEVKRKVAEKLS
jgi:hypothetical protein